MLLVGNRDRCRRGGLGHRHGHGPGGLATRGELDSPQQVRRLLEGPLVAPESQQLAAERQDGPQVDPRADILLPAPLEHQRGVEDHQPDREEQRQHQHRRRDDVPDPVRSLRTSGHPWIPSWDSDRSGSVAAMTRDSYTGGIAPAGGSVKASTDHPGSASVITHLIAIIGTVARKTSARVAIAWSLGGMPTSSWAWNAPADRAARSSLDRVGPRSEGSGSTSFPRSVHDNRSTSLLEQTLTASTARRRAAWHPTGRAWRLARCRDPGDRPARGRGRR